MTSGRRQQAGPQQQFTGMDYFKHRMDGLEAKVDGMMALLRQVASAMQLTPQHSNGTAGPHATTAAGAIPGTMGSQGGSTTAGPTQGSATGGTLRRIKKKAASAAAGGGGQAANPGAGTGHASQASGDTKHSSAGMPDAGSAIPSAAATSAATVSHDTTSRATVGVDTSGPSVVPHTGGHANAQHSTPSSMTSHPVSRKGERPPAIKLPADISQPKSAAGGSGGSVGPSPSFQHSRQENGGGRHRREAHPQPAAVRTDDGPIAADAGHASAEAATGESAAHQPRPDEDGSPSEAICTLYTVATDAVLRQDTEDQSDALVGTGVLPACCRVVDTSEGSSVIDVNPPADMPPVDVDQLVALLVGRCTYCVLGVYGSARRDGICYGCGVPCHYSCAA